MFRVSVSLLSTNMRPSFSIVALILILSTPYWLYLPFIFVGIVVFPLYVEAIVLGAVVDTVYGGFSLGITSTLLVLIALPLRKHFRFHA